MGARCAPPLTSASKLIAVHTMPRNRYCNTKNIGNCCHGATSNLPRRPERPHSTLPTQSIKPTPQPAHKPAQEENPTRLPTLHALLRHNLPCKSNRNLTLQPTHQKQPLLNYPATLKHQIMPRYQKSRNLAPPNLARAHPTIDDSNCGLVLHNWATHTTATRTTP